MTLRLLTAHFLWPLPVFWVSKRCDPPSVSTPFPPAHFWQVPYFEPTGSCFPNLICSRIVRVCNVFNVHKYSKNFSSPNYAEKAPSLVVFSRPNFRAESPSGLLPTSYPCFKELINNIFSAIQDVDVLLFFHQTIKTRQETLFDWLIIESLVWITRQEFIVHSQSHSLDRPNFLKSNLDSELFHGYKDLAGQSSWWSILFCVYVYIHWSKAVALFAQFLSSLPERYSTNERRPW